MEPIVSKRYAEKLKTYLNGEDFDKIDLDKWMKDSSMFPTITYPDIFNYLVLETSNYTHEEFKVLKFLPIFLNVGNIIGYLSPGSCASSYTIYSYNCRIPI